MTKDELQFKWDELLMQARFFCPDTKMYTLRKNFEVLYGEYPEVLGLLRCQHPVDGGYFPTYTAVRFICAHLPKIADHCWKYTKADWLAVLGTVNRSSHDTRKLGTLAIGRRESVARRAESKEIRNTLANGLLCRDKRQAFNTGEQWSVCK